MTRHLVYLVGEPAVGKSTLMAELTEDWLRHPMPPEPGAPARDFLLDPTRPFPVAVELGRRRPSVAGTDALPLNAAVEAERYLRSGRAEAEAPLLLGEGARLATERFLRAAVDTGWTTTVLYLFGPRVSAMRRAARPTVPGRAPARVEAAQDAARRVANSAGGWGCTVVPVDVQRVESDPEGSPYRQALVAEVARAWQVERELVFR